MDKQFTIHEKDEEESDISPRRVDRGAVEITVAAFPKESEKRLPGLTSDSNFSPIMKSRVLRKQTDNSIFTEESLKDLMVGSDKAWYENLGKIKERESEKELYQSTFKGSNEDWKDKMSVSSSSNNAEKLYLKATLHLSPKRMPLVKQPTIFKSKETFQSMWHN